MRGRWFLAKHGRRSRAADTEMLLDAITRLELVLLPRRRPVALILAQLSAVKREALFG